MNEKKNTFTDPYYTYYIVHKSKNFEEWYKKNTISFKEYRKNWIYRPESSHKGEFPLSLNIEITTKCNLACTFCYHRELNKEQKIHMDMKLFKKIIDEAKKYALPAVNLNGLGEPITHPKLIEMIRYCKEAGIEDIMFHTNGTVMTEKQAKGIVEAGCTRIIFSLDSPNKKTYESMRIGANFEEVNNNVLKFLKIRNSLKSKTPLVTVTMVLTDKTVNEADEFKKKWKNHADHITAQDLVYSFDTIDKTTNSESWISYEKSYYQIDKDKIIHDQKKNIEKFRCAYLYQSLKIHPDGKIDPCTPRNAPTIADLSKGQTIKDAWNSNTVEDMRNMHEKGEWFNVPACKNCDHPYIAIYKKENKIKEI